MSSDVCPNCGEERSPRYYKGKVRPIGCSCYSGGRSVARSGFSTPKQPTSPPKPSLRRFDRKDEDYTRPSICSECQKEVWFVQHNGGCVLFDALGQPWPRHECCWPSRSSAKALKNLEQRYDQEQSGWKIGVVRRVRCLAEEDHYLVAIRWATATDNQTVWKVFGLGNLDVGELAQVQSESIGSKLFLGNAHSFEIKEKGIDPRELEFAADWSGDRSICVVCKRTLGRKEFLQHCYDEHCRTQLFPEFYQVVKGGVFSGFGELTDEARCEAMKLRSAHQKLIRKPPTPAPPETSVW